MGNIPVADVSMEAHPVPAKVATRLPCEPASVTEARQVLEPLEPAVDEETIRTLKLLVTELVSNSVRHSASASHEEIELSVAASPESVRVEVADSGPGFEPRPREQGQDEDSGWGLHLVDHLSDRLGHTRAGGGWRCGSSSTSTARAPPGPGVRRPPPEARRDA